VKSRERLFWQVRLYTEGNAEPGAWSEKAFFEYGLLEPSDWEGRFITPEPVTPALRDWDQTVYLKDHPGLSAGTDDAAKKLKNFKPHLPAGYLRKAFTVKAEQLRETARLYMTAHGVFIVRLNSEEISPDEVLAPGTGNYGSHLEVRAYDVAGLLKEGENLLEVTLGDGWWRGENGLKGNRNVFGEDLSLLAQLEISGKVLVKSDESWEGSVSGPVRMNDTEQGEIYDALSEDITDWQKVRLAAENQEAWLKALVGTDTLLVRRKERLKGTLLETPDGSLILDFGQNLAGGIRFQLTAHKGNVLTFRLGEALDENGNFTNANFQPGEKHSEGAILQRLIYRCKEGLNTYRTEFFIAGFRYAKVTLDGSQEALKAMLSEGEVFAEAFYSDMEERASFHSDNEDLNRLFQNAMWSMKGNFCDIPTDCPTRERSGWTGDMGVFAPTGLRLMDSVPVMKKWLAQCRLQQHQDGSVPNICPSQGPESFFSKILSVSVGWGDAVVLVPWAIYQYTGETAVLKENLSMMTRWVEFLRNRAKKRPVKKLFSRETYESYNIDTGVDYGEWCEIGVGIEAMKPGQGSTGTAYLAHSADLLSRIYEVLGDTAKASDYRKLSENAKKAFHEYYTDGGRITGNRQCEYVRAIAFDLLSAEEKVTAAADLNRLILANGCKLNTGFLSTPFLCSVLVEYGYPETAWHLLMQDQMPSWLYEVKKGATTVWERWEGVEEDGRVHESLNHYSYGSIAGWMLMGPGGIHFEQGKLRFCPVLPDASAVDSLSEVAASLMTPAGPAGLSWKREGTEGEEGKFSLTLTVPCGTQAQLCLPNGEVKVISAGETHLTVG